MTFDRVNWVRSSESTVVINKIFMITDEQITS
jgi:hypothetical protein